MQRAVALFEVYNIYLHGLPQPHLQLLHVCNDINATSTRTKNYTLFVFFSISDRNFIAYKYLEAAYLFVNGLDHHDFFNRLTFIH